MKLGRLPWFGALGLICCQTSVERPASTQHAVAPPHVGASGAVSECDYTVRVPAESPGAHFVLDVQVHCRGRAISGLRAKDELTAENVVVLDSRGQPIARSSSSFLLPAPRQVAGFSYRVDLDRLAHSARNTALDYAMRRDSAWLAPASSFLLHPLPLATDTRVRIHVETKGHAKFASGLLQRGDDYSAFAHELPVASYAALGEFDRYSAHVGASELEIAVLGSRYALSPERLRDYVLDGARLVADFYGRFPVPHVFVSVVSVPEVDSIVFGRLLPESGPGIVLLVGEKAGEAALERDWVLVHELLHLGVPSFDNEGKWFDEGLATYFEPLIQARAGRRSSQAAFSEFAREMPRGLGALTQHGLETAKTSGGIYWGGALFCLIADVEIRRASGGRVGLEAGLRAILEHGGNASEVWDLQDALKVADSAFPHPVLLPLKQRFADGTSAFDLAELWNALGVELRGPDVTFDDSAPLARVRQTLTEGASSR
ncbi:MAG TPA: hypothetical protein VFQ61_02330 [Polyangiaceae bacterium]|nr:hypothetical protein [Polyangiaceae bacterium]